MTDLEALDEAIRRTGVERYRYLCSDANTLPPPNDPASWLVHMHVVAEDPDLIIAQVEAMAARARSGETGGAGCGGCP